MIPIGETHDGRADMTNFEMDLFDTKMITNKQDRDEDICCRSSRSRIIKPACFPITIVSLLIIALVFLPLLNEDELISPTKLPTQCDQPCRMNLAESIPTGMVYNGTVRHSKTHEEWLDIINNAEKYIEIAALYWNLNTSDYPTASPGKQVLQALANAGKRNVKVHIAQDVSKGLSDNAESAWLAKEGLAQVRTLNFTSLLGSGVLHTKFIIVDLKHVYIGSANMDWKALTEVKEMGIVIRDCPCIAADLYKIFAVYWKLGEEGARVPDRWPISYRTPYNALNPMSVTLNRARSDLFLSSSPQPFNPKHRENDLDAIVGIIAKAKSSVCVAVMDFIPATLYMENKRYWPDLDNALREAAFRGVHVRLLVGKWNYTKPEEEFYLKSLSMITPAFHTGGSIEVKWFVVPSTPEQAKIEYTRVNHNKYMVTDKTGYIGTSNWAGDYFTTTGGVGLSVSSNDSESVREQLQAVFDRDWFSSYAIPL